MLRRLRGAIGSFLHAFLRARNASGQASFSFLFSLRVSRPSGDKVSRDRRSPRSLPRDAGSAFDSLEALSRDRLSARRILSIIASPCFERIARSRDPCHEINDGVASFRRVSWRSGVHSSNGIRRVIIRSR